MMDELGHEEVDRTATARRSSGTRSSSIFAMADSGRAARSAAQIRQLAGDAWPDGEAGRLDYRDADYHQLP